MGQRCSFGRVSKDAEGKGTGEATKTSTAPNNSEDIRDDYKIGGILGSGAFGQVRECTYRHTPSGEKEVVRAVKIMEKRSPTTSPPSPQNSDWSNYAMFKREISLLANLNHAHIIKYLDFYEDEHFLYAVMEKCDGGELFEQICKRRRFTETDASALCQQMLLALQYIHQQGIVHRDVKAENFLFLSKSQHSTIKMIDFGMSAKLLIPPNSTTTSAKLKEVCGSPHYLAPELIKKNYDTKADMWALGVVIYLMLFGRYPFDGKETRDIVREVMSKRLDLLWESNGRYRYSACAIDFLKSLLVRDASVRLSAEEALRHPWIVGKGEEKEEREEREEKREKGDVIEYVRSAQKKLTIAKPVVAPSVEKRRNELLMKLEEQFERGIRTGHRIGRGDAVAAGGKVMKPEFSRHDKRMATTPSRMEQYPFLLDPSMGLLEDNATSASKKTLEVPGEGVHEVVVSNSQECSNNVSVTIPSMDRVEERGEKVERGDRDSGVVSLMDMSHLETNSTHLPAVQDSGHTMESGRASQMKAFLQNTRVSKEKSDWIMPDGVGSLANDLRALSSEVDANGRRKSKRAFTALAPLNLVNEQLEEEQQVSNKPKQ